ncbi:Membrane-associated 30 kDa protein, chloroplastic [Seminavis robusta]|uniref:Membrane-associated 30 kDa protein, chloroplastic n=1 Tax=Seminavis robusta TaxID=568900 RepID=A0A9N8DPW0_9STRA|nr:Membrane-associated 30 kDa protein, chloroplastic [Seminavis robusta]|eukprot:Sro270_g104310.1 Membrane-associated 30 kDa protein, chloroplastic (318) ;mRNA; r:60344-61392
MKLSVTSSLSPIVLSFICHGAVVQGFVPVSGPIAAKTTYVPGINSVTAGPRTRAAHTSLAMQGNLFDRFVRVFNANVNKIVSGLEDPEKVIVQAVDDMQTDLVKIRQTYAETTARQRRLQRQKDQADADGEAWYVRANLALRKGNEGLAREALGRRQAFVDKSMALENQLETQRLASDKMYDAMMSLENKIKEATSKKEQLIARARTAKSMQQVNDMLSGLGGGKNSMSAFTRMEEKVEALEAAAEASTDLTLIPDMSMESEFRLLEQSSEVENELRKMKADLKMLSPSAAASKDIGITMPERKRVTIPVGRGANFN